MLKDVAFKGEAALLKDVKGVEVYCLAQILQYYKEVLKDVAFKRKVTLPSHSTAPHLGALIFTPLSLV